MFFSCCPDVWSEMWNGLDMCAGEERKDKEKKVTLPTVSNYTIHDADDPSNAKQEGTGSCIYPFIVHCLTQAAPIHLFDLPISFIPCFRLRNGSAFVRE
jgi:hypothetical protein